MAVKKKTTETLIDAVHRVNGVTEAKNTRDEHFGLERLEQIVRATGGQNSYSICKHITRAVHDFSSKVGGPGDDLTISVIKVN